MKTSKLICFNVPVALCEHVIAYKLINPFRLYLYLKTFGNKVCINDLLKKESAMFLDIASVKTINANLNKLVLLNWIGFNSNNQTHFIRGFETLMALIDAKHDIAVPFYKSDFKTFRGFLAGAIIGYLSCVQLWKLKNKNKGQVKEPKKGGSSQLTLHPYFFPVSIVSIAKILTISQSTAHNLKEQAFKAKYIAVLPTLHPMDIDPSLIRQYLKAHPTKAGRFRVISKRVYEIGPLMVKANMRYKRRKKTKHIMGDERGNQSQIQNTSKSSNIYN